MPQKIDSEKLTQLAGQPVEVTVMDGETLEQAEARVMQEHPDVFKQDIASELSQSENVQGPIPPELLQAANEAFANGDDKELARVKKAIDIYKASQPKAEKVSILAEKADSKKYINDLVAAGEAKRVLGNVEKAKQGVNTGPFATRFFDASVPQYDADANLKSPGIIDSVITSLFPEQTGKMRLLDASIQGMSDYAFDKGGKNLTGTEKTAIFNRQPTRFDDDAQFNDVMKQSRADLENFIVNRVETLKGLGYPEDQINGILNKELSQTGEEKPSFLQSKISPQQVQKKTPPKTGLTPEEQAELDAINKQLGM